MVSATEQSGDASTSSHDQRQRFHYGRFCCSQRKWRSAKSCCGRTGIKCRVLFVLWSPTSDRHVTSTEPSSTHSNLRVLGSATASKCFHWTVSVLPASSHCVDHALTYSFVSFPFLSLGKFGLAAVAIKTISTSIITCITIIHRQHHRRPIHKSIYALE